MREVKEMLYRESVRGTIGEAVDRAIMLQVLLDNWSGLLQEKLERGLEGRKASEAGQSLVEYAIALALIAIAAMGAVQALGGGVGNLFQRLVARIQGIG